METFKNILEAVDHYESIKNPTIKDFEAIKTISCDLEDEVSFYENLDARELTWEKIDERDATNELFERVEAIYNNMKTVLN